MENEAVLNPIEDQRKEALRHYEEVATRAHHWSSFVRNAILAYNPQQPPVRSAEEILEKYFRKDPANDWTPHILKAMQEYADQFRSKHQANDTKPDAER